MKKFAPIILLLLMAGCSDPLRSVADSMNKAAKSIAVVQTLIIEANEQQFVSDKDTATVLKACITVNQTGKDVTGIIKPLVDLDLNSKQMIFRVVLPSVTAVQGLLDSNLLYIKNEESKQKVRAALLSVQSALSAIQLIVAGA